MNGQKEHKSLFSGNRTTVNLFGQRVQRRRVQNDGWFHVGSLGSKRWGRVSSQQVADVLLKVIGNKTNLESLNFHDITPSFKLYD